MKILGLDLTERGEQAYQEIKDSLTKPVIINKLDPKMVLDTNGRMSEEENHFRIELNVKMDREAFDSVLIHELLHCKQLQEGSPSITAAYENDTLSVLASAINGMVNDIDVENRMEAYGLHSEKIDWNRYQDFKELLSYIDDEPELNEPGIILGACMLILIKYTSHFKEHYDDLIHHIKEKGYLEFLELAEKFDEILKTHGYSSPREQLRSLRRIAIATGLRDEFLLVVDRIAQEI